MCIRKNDARPILKVTSPTGSNTQTWDIVPGKMAHGCWKAVSLIQLIICYAVMYECIGPTALQNFHHSWPAVSPQVVMFRPTWDLPLSIMSFFKPNVIGSNKKSIRLIKMRIRKQRTPYIKSD